MRQVPLPLVEHSAATFDSFIPGRNEHLLFQLQADVPPRSPCYLWGPAGSGKTHLLQALRHACEAAGGKTATWGRGTLGAAALDEDVRLLILDDVHLLDAASQHAVFGLLVEAQARGVPWAAAGPLPPVDLPLREDLRTRFGWGQVHAVEPLPEDQTRQALRAEARRRGLTLGDEVLDYLLSRFARDLGHLMQLLDRMDHFALSQARSVTVPLIRQMLAEEPAPAAQERQAGLELGT